VITTDPKGRKDVPLATGVLDYFPDALAAVAAVSVAGNAQHNPGQPLHWAKGKSTDHRDSLLRHLVDSGRLDIDGQRHSAKVAWRALAQLQIEIEQEQIDAGYETDANKYREPAAVRVERTKQVAGHTGFRQRLPDGTITTDRDAGLRIDVV
jgi:hypothetical protein